MTLRIRRADPQTADAVRAFNTRMADAGSRWKFYVTDRAGWLAPEEGASAWREYVLAVDDKDGTVRGGFALKQQAFLLNGCSVLIGNCQGPVSEGIINRRFALLGVVMLNDALSRQPLQIGWGTSGQKAALLTQAGWPSAQLPILLHVVRKGAFFRRNRILSRPLLAKVTRVGSFLGLPQLALGLAQGALAIRAPSLRELTVLEEADFGVWAECVWEAAASHYSLIAVRDAKSLNTVMPPGAWPNAIPLKIERRGQVIGWSAIRDRRLSDDNALLGGLRVAAVIDALAIPGDEAAVAAATVRHVRERGVDVIVAAFSHSRWIQAFRSAGFLTLPRRRRLCLSPALAKEGRGLEALLPGAHLALIDGDGPRIF